MVSNPKVLPTFMHGDGAICGSISSVETLTPESGAGGRPSRASAALTGLSPSSRLSRADPADRFLARALSRDDAHSFSSSQVADYGVDFVKGNFARPPTFRKVPGARQRPTEHRRRKYRVPCHCTSSGTSSATHQVSGDEGSEPRARAPIPYNPALWGTDLDETEVLCEGPLEQRCWMVFWISRWCIIDRREFRIYADEEASLRAPELPLERYNVLNVSMAPDLHSQSLLVVVGFAGEPLVFLRTGTGLRREELVASSLWLAAFAASARYATSTQAAKKRSKVKF